jgi:hypothetical protein
MLESSGETATLSGLGTKKLNDPLVADVRPVAEIVCAPAPAPGIVTSALNAPVASVVTFLRLRVSNRTCTLSADPNPPPLTTTEVPGGPDFTEIATLSALVDA